MRIIHGCTLYTGKYGTSTAATANSSRSTVCVLKLSLQITKTVTICYEMNFTLEAMD